jgi:hypothetical protein
MRFEVLTTVKMSMLVDGGMHPYADTNVSGKYTVSTFRAEDIAVKNRTTVYQLVDGRGFCLRLLIGKAFRTGNILPTLAAEKSCYRLYCLTDDELTRKEKEVSPLWSSNFPAGLRKTDITCYQATI